MRQSTECDALLLRLGPKWLRKYVYQSILCELQESVIVDRSVHGVLCVEIPVVGERGSRKLLTRAHHQEEGPSLLITLSQRASTVCELVNVKQLARARWRVLAAGTGYENIKVCKFEILKN